MGRVRIELRLSNKIYSLTRQTNGFYEAIYSNKGLKARVVGMNTKASYRAGKSVST